MDKTIARIELSVQNKVDMSIHQHKSKNQDIATFCYGKYSVHPVTKILIVPEQTLNRVSGCIEMPTVIDLNDLSFNHRPFKSQIGGNVWKKYAIRLHNIQFTLVVQRKINSNSVVGRARCKYERFLRIKQFSKNSIESAMQRTERPILELFF